MSEITCALQRMQGVLRSFRMKPCSEAFSEIFAVKRYLKKFQEPDRNQASLLKQKCWDDWLQFDQSLARVKPADFISFPLLYKARQMLKNIRPVEYSTFALPQGSEVVATRGQNSIESRLCRSVWTCTPDNFQRFARFVWECKAMKRAFRQRYTRWYRKSKFLESQHAMDKYIFRRFRERGSDDPAWDSFEYKLSMVTRFVPGSRFSRVRKNNETDRPINVEPLGNIVVQRQIGEHIRRELKRLFSVDLDTLAQRHREMIAEICATIDMKNASDAITIALCRFLLPRHLFDACMNARSEFVFGLDKAYHQTLKISSMGNGFTFELMTLILTAVSRCFDEKASVFGDDIICRNEVAKPLIETLQHVGFTVNQEKSFINSEFRESCGANYHDRYGYIESYDFRWPETLHDCVVFYNKALRLSKKYQSFEKLREALRRHIPSVLQGVIENDFFEKEIKPTTTNDDPVEFSNFFRCRSHQDHRCAAKGGLKRKLVKYASRYNYSTSDVKIFEGLSYNEKLRTPTLKHLGRTHWAKYEMYLYSGRRAKDVLTGYGGWVSCKFLSVAGTTIRWSDSALE